LIGVVRNTVSTLRVVFAVAVDDGLLADNPTSKVKVPRGSSEEMDFLNALEVEQVAQAIRAGFGPWVRFMAYSGLRFGEAAALRMRVLDGPGSLAIDCGAHAMTIKQRMGHADISTTRRPRM